MQPGPEAFDWPTPQCRMLNDGAQRQQEQGRKRVRFDDVRALAGLQMSDGHCGSVTVAKLPTPAPSQGGVGEFEAER